MFIPRDDGTRGPLARLAHDTHDVMPLQREIEIALDELTSISVPGNEVAWLRREILVATGRGSVRNSRGARWC